MALTSVMTGYNHRLLDYCERKDRWLTKYNGLSYPQLQYFGHLMRRVDSLEKTDAGRDWGQEEKGTTEDDMAGWHHLNGHEFGWTPGDGDGQEGLACCNSWGRKESDTNEQLNWTQNLIWKLRCFIINFQKRQAALIVLFSFVVSVCVINDWLSPFSQPIWNHSFRDHVG